MQKWFNPQNHFKWFGIHVNIAPYLDIHFGIENITFCNKKKKNIHIFTHFLCLNANKMLFFNYEVEMSNTNQYRLFSFDGFSTIYNAFFSTFSNYKAIFFARVLWFGHCNHTLRKIWDKILKKSSVKLLKTI